MNVLPINILPSTFSRHDNLSVDLSCSCEASRDSWQAVITKKKMHFSLQPKCVARIRFQAGKIRRTESA